MAIKKKVVDASVIFKWIEKEEFSNNANTLKEKYLKREIDIIVPDLIFYEVANALKYKGREKSSIEQAMKDLFDMQFQIVRINEFLLCKIISLAATHNITVYDAAYVAASELYAAELITTDSFLKNKVNNTILLKDFKI